MVQDFFMHLKLFFIFFFFFFGFFGLNLYNGLRTLNMFTLGRLYSMFYYKDNPHNLL